jgi:hypothetical protein
MLYCKSVSIPYEPILDTRIITDVQQHHTTFDTSRLNLNFVNYLTKLNVTVAFAEIFYTKTNIVTPIHIDSNIGDFVKINYIYGGQDSYMMWYEPISESSGKHAITCVGSPFVAYTKSEVRPIYLQTITTPSIVQVGCPHNIFNKSQDRHCLSLVIAENYKRISMSRAIEIFEKII